MFTRLFQNKSVRKYSSLATVGFFGTSTAIAFCNSNSAATNSKMQNIIPTSTHRPITGYTRVDTHLELHPEWVENNAFHGTLRGENMIEDFEVYLNNDPNDIHVKCLIRFGKSLNGHPGVVHGGITAITFDNCFGWLFLGLKLPPSFTANLNINFRYLLIYLFILMMCMYTRNKIPENSLVILTAKLVERVDRKLHMEGVMTDVNGTVLADAKCLFIIARPNQ